MPPATTPHPPNQAAPPSIVYRAPDCRGPWPIRPAIHSASCPTNAGVHPAPPSHASKHERDSPGFSGSPANSSCKPPRCGRHCHSLSPPLPPTHLGPVLSCPSLRDLRLVLVHPPALFAALEWHLYLCLSNTASSPPPSPQPPALPSAPHTCTGSPATPPPLPHSQTRSTSATGGSACSFSSCSYVSSWFVMGQGRLG